MRQFAAVHPRRSGANISAIVIGGINNMQNAPVQKQPEMTSLLLGAGFALASLIILPAVAQRVGLGSSVTIALRGALMRAANRF